MPQVTLLATVELGFEPWGQSREPLGRICWKQKLGSLCLLTWLLIGSCHRSVPWGNRSLGLNFSLSFEGTVVPEVWHCPMNLRGLLLLSVCRFLWTCFLFYLALTCLLSWDGKPTRPISPSLTRGAPLVGGEAPVLSHLVLRPHPPLWATSGSPNLGSRAGPKSYGCVTGSTRATSPALALGNVATVSTASHSRVWW